MTTPLSLTAKIDLLRSKGLSDQEIDQLLSVAPSSASNAQAQALQTFTPLFADKPADEWNEQVEDVLEKGKRLNKVLIGMLLWLFTSIGFVLYNHEYSSPYSLIVIAVPFLCGLIYSFCQVFIGGWYYKKLRLFFKKVPT